MIFSILYALVVSTEHGADVFQTPNNTEIESAARCYRQEKLLIIIIVARHNNRSTAQSSIKTNRSTQL